MLIVGSVATNYRPKFLPPIKAANLLTNGGFEIWQRGNGPFTANVFTADRWSTGLQGTDALSISRDTTNVDIHSIACCAATFTLGTGTGATGLQQQCKQSDGYQLKNQTFSFSVRIRTSVANAVRIVAFGDVTPAVYSAYHSGSGAYQTLSVTIALGASDTILWFAVYFAASCTAYLDNAMLVVGNVPADYVPLHPADDLNRCLRYYEIIGTNSSSIEMGTGAVYSTTAAGIGLRYITKPVTPTITLTGLPSLIAATGATIAMTSSNVNGAGLNTAALLCNVASGLVAGNATRLYTTAAGQYISVEANP
jgi:hypothetical protein